MLRFVPIRRFDAVQMVDEEVLHQPLIIRAACPVPAAGNEEQAEGIREQAVVNDDLLLRLDLEERRLRDVQRVARLGVFARRMFRLIDWNGSFSASYFSFAAAESDAASFS